MRRKRSMRRRMGRSRRREKEDINPMSYISNLSDVMLILAVGIMLSLVIHWKVDLDTVKGSDQAGAESKESELEVKTTFTDNDLEDSENVPRDLERLGAVYYDPESGTYYIAEEPENSGENGG